MHLSTALTTLSAFAVMSTSVSAFQANFDTWDVPGCMGSGDAGRLNHYPMAIAGECAPLPNARSIKVYYTESPSCQVNTYSELGCNGTVTSYKFEDYNAPCRPVDGKVSYKVTC